MARASDHSASRAPSRDRKYSRRTSLIRRFSLATVMLPEGDGMPSAPAMSSRSWSKVIGAPLSSGLPAGSSDSSGVSAMAATVCSSTPAEVPAAGGFAGSGAGGFMLLPPDMTIQPGEVPAAAPPGRGSIGCTRLTAWRARS